MEKLKKPLKKKTKASNMYISEDIIAAEILPRLPVKSLLKFRCVSNSWCSLISNNRDFIKSHLKNSKNNQGFDGMNIIACCNENQSLALGYKKSSMMHCPLSLWFYQPSIFSVHDFRSINGYYYSKPSQDSVYLVGSCNGLCCIQRGKELVVWNPATNHSYKLPDLAPSLNREAVTLAGFGFNEANDDYKILSLSICFTTQLSKRANEILVTGLYSSRTNSWEILENFWEGNRYYSSMKFLNGKLYWQGYYLYLGFSVRIHSFDLERQVYTLVEQPEDYFVGGSNVPPSLGILDGCLSITHTHSNGNEIQVWMMKDKESWHRVASIRTSSDMSHIRYRPLCMGKDGGILFSSHNGFMIYDPKTKLCRRSDWKQASYICAEIYVESLVSPIPLVKQ